MNTFVYWIYLACVGLIKIYKWIEYRILLIFQPVIEYYFKQYLGRIDVILVEDKSSLKINPDKNLPCNKYSNVLQLKVKDKNFYAKVANGGTLGLGESFMENGWDVFNENYEDLAEFYRRLMENNYHEYYFNCWNRFLEWVELHAFNLQTSERAFSVGIQHYDTSMAA